MANKLRWGIVGTGSIARKFANALVESSSSELVAIGSRSPERATRFVQDFATRAHGSYEELLADKEVDVVYISTPHPWHAKWIIKAAEAGKHILCEKPFAMNHAEAVTALEAAWRADVFLMEAFMYRCHPQTARLRKLLRDGAIGTVKYARAAFSFDGNFRPDSRAINHALGGGGILDVGCYCTSMLRLIAGEVNGKAFIEPEEVKGVAHIGAESRVDEFALASLRFPGGILGEAACGVQLALENNVRIVGTGGSIVIPEPWTPSREANFSKIIIFRGGVPEEIVIETDRSLYAIEADYVAEQINEGRRESRAMPWDDTLGNMKTLDLWRESIGLVYDADQV